MIKMYALDDHTVTHDPNMGGVFVGMFAGVDENGFTLVAVDRNTIFKFNTAITGRVSAATPNVSNPSRTELSRECPCGLARVECKYHGEGTR
jgi:hypothetical protein